MRPLVIDSNKDIGSELNDGPTPPAELVSKIIMELQQDRQYAVLAEMALANSTFYDLVIPKLYETVTITAENRDRMTYVSHPSQCHGKIVRVDKDGNVMIDPNEPPHDTTKTRKDRTFEWCRRLIIDTPTAHFMSSIEYIVDLLPHHRYGNVEELVFTRRAMRIPGYYEDVFWLSRILSPMIPIGTGKEVSHELPKTKRVVLYVVDYHEYREMFGRLSEWCKQRRNLRKPTQFAIHNLNLETSPYDLGHMRLNCHFRHYNELAGSFGTALAQWLVIPFRQVDLKSLPKLNLFDVYRFLMTDKELSQNPANASQQAMSIIERDLDTLVDAGPNRAERIRQIMASISFHKAAYEDEYPTSRPIPVSYCDP